MPACSRPRFVSVCEVFTSNPMTQVSERTSRFDPRAIRSGSGISATPRDSAGLNDTRIKVPIAYPVA
jgi:hypothetical protein